MAQSKKFFTKPYCLCITNYEKVLFGSARTELGHLENPQLTRHSHRQEAGAIRAVTLHSLNSNAGMKQYKCGQTQPLL
jgi:hypothetical protein